MSEVFSSGPEGQLVNRVLRLGGIPRKKKLGYKGRRLRGLGKKHEIT